MKPAPDMRESGSDKLSVCLVDDDKLVLSSFVQLLSSWDEISIAGAYSEPRAALAELSVTAPEVVLMDIRMPGLSGIECMSLVKASSPSTAVVMLTAITDVSAMLQSFKAGATGFLVKGCAGTLIRGSIHCSHLGAVVIPERMKEKLWATPIDLRSVAAPLRTLSGREEDVMELLNRGLDDKTIANRLALSANRIKSIKRSLFAKWGAHSRSEVILKSAVAKAPLSEARALHAAGLATV